MTDSIPDILTDIITDIETDIWIWIEILSWAQLNFSWFHDVIEFLPLQSHNLFFPMSETLTGENRVIWLLHARAERTEHGPNQVSRPMAVCRLSGEDILS